MQRLLLVSAALFATAIISPAQAQQFAASGFSGHHGHHRSSPQFTGRDDRGFDCDVRSDRRDRHDGRRDRRRSDDCVIVGGNLGYLDYGDYDANRSFDPNLWNDWWHDRPDRSYPRWVQQNQNCEPDRMWWSGSGWHC